MRRIYLKSFAVILCCCPFLFAEQTAFSIASGENNTNYFFWEQPYGLHSDIDFSALPPNIITNIEVQCRIESSWLGYVDAALADSSQSNFYYLFESAHGYINRTIPVTAFNGLPLNKIWSFHAIEYNFDYHGFLDYWSIKIYYTDPAPYCPAGGTGDEYICEVICGDIDKITDSNYYSNYTGTDSTSMTIGQSCPIEIITAIPGYGPGYGYTGDRCGIWIDWNQDNDFDDTGEMVFSETGVGYFITNITPPADAIEGQTRMRIRLAYNETLTPCGPTPSGGEVEDYTINVLPGAIPGDFVPPEGVDFIDYSVFAKQWLLEKLSFDTAPTAGDGIVNFLDFANFAQNWQGDYNQLYDFAYQWLMRGMYNADIAPPPNGDGIVDYKDLQIFADNWLSES
ncbi:MAG TPA: hypothetical protein DDX75_02080 [Phycisphaerales bacterium]|nr:hypothetical protein [Phycisphaerales bacterium]